MLKYYFRTSWRRLCANKTYTFLNVTGLAIGLASFILIALFVYDEMSYDSFHEHKDRMYRVVSDITWPASSTNFVATSSRPVADVLRNHHAVEEAVRLVPIMPTITHRDQHYRDQDIYYAEPAFFDVFTFPLMEGDPGTALQNPYTAIITESAAQLLFGDQSPLGQEVTFNHSFPVTITGVAADPPFSSHLSFDVLVSYSTHDIIRPAPASAQWLEVGMYTYLKLTPGADVRAFRHDLRSLPDEHYGSILEQYGVTMELGLQPIADIYLQSRRTAEIGPVGDQRIVLAISVIALFILLISCINYMNLTTARSMNRAKEMGVRKAVGADRSMLVRQLLMTSVLTTTAAMAVGLWLANAALPLLNNLTGKELTFGTLLSPLFIAFLVILTLAVGLLAGAYPAKVLSGYHAAPILKGRFSSSTEGVQLRKGLVTFQFAISVALILGTLVIFQQVNYVRTQDLGFDAEQLMTIDARGIPQFATQFESAKDDLLKHAAVHQVAVSSSSPGREPWLLLMVAEGLEEGESRQSHVIAIDHDYVSTYGIEVIAGRSFSKDHESDVYEAALINERAVENFGWSNPQEALGKWLQFGEEQRSVVGVVADYHHLSLRQQVEPMKMLYLSNMFNTFTLRLRAGDTSRTIAEIRRIWEQHFPGQAFVYSFVDERFNQQYRSEVQIARMMGIFAILAIGLACLGLLGLSAFTAQQRRREIGIRKIVGATSESIFGMLSKDFLKLVAVGFCIGAPIGYVAMDQWLSGFAHRITIGPGIIVLTGTIALLIALLTVSYQAIRSAWMNPTEAVNH